MKHITTNILRNIYHVTTFGNSITTPNILSTYIRSPSSRRRQFNHYRFSIAWTRIQPHEHAAPNAAGLRHYSRLIDALLASRIQPIVTMYHWDMPQWLQDQGGMLNASAATRAFTAYADVLFAAFGSRVRTWITINEPSVMCNYGYSEALLAPRVRSPGVGVYRCMHTVLLVHAHIWRLYDRRYRHRSSSSSVPAGQVGLALSTDWAFPRDPLDARHRAAADRALQFNVGTLLHPLLAPGGGYPPVVMETVARRSRGRSSSRLPAWSAAERELVAGALDFVGVNYYTSRLVEPAVKPIDASPSFDNDQEILATVDERWPHAKSPRIYAVPEGLRAVLKYDRVTKTPF